MKFCFSFALKEERGRFMQRLRTNMEQANSHPSMHFFIHCMPMKFASQLLLSLPVFSPPEPLHFRDIIHTDTVHIEWHHWKADQTIQIGSTREEGEDICKSNLHRHNCLVRRWRSGLGGYMYTQQIFTLFHFSNQSAARTTKLNWAVSYIWYVYFSKQIQCCSQSISN